MHFTNDQQPLLALLDNEQQKVLVNAWSDVSTVEVENHDNYESFIRAIETKPTMLALISWNTNEPESSADHLARVRSAIGEMTRLVVLADNNPETDVVTALRMGADRFITIDNSLNIFDARMKAVLRRIKPDQGFQHFPPYHMNQMTREVMFDDQRIQLTPREFRIAQYLFENCDQVLSREALLRDIWELPDLKYKRRVDTKMSHVRRKMCLDGSYGWQLKFPRGKGYQLNREVETAASNCE